MTPEDQERLLEALLFLSPGPVPLAALRDRLPDPEAAIAALERRREGRGVVLVRVAGGVALRTAPDLAPHLAREAVEVRRLSRAGVETLAVVAYHGPVTRAEIEEIRGVGLSRGTLDQLLEMGWIKPGRRRATPGRPATYVCTDAFLDHFGLASLQDLPSLAELRAAGFLAGPEGR